jgi:hypothetical protein
MNGGNQVARIEFNDLIIESLSDASGVFTGNNIQFKWKSYPVINQGYGEIAGNSNKYINNKNIIIKRKINFEDK